MRKHCDPMALVVLLMLAMAPAIAQEQHGAATAPPGEAAAAEAGGHGAPAQPATHEAAGGGHGEEEMPPLLQFDPGAAVWSIVIFVLLLVLLRATAWKPILRVLNEREEFIQKSLDDARLERQEAERLLAEYKAQLERARQEAGAIVEEGRRNAEEVRRRIQQEAREEAQDILERARRDIRLAKDAAIKDLYDQTAELAVRVASGILKKEISPEAHRQLVADSLAEMRNTGRENMN